MAEPVPTSVRCFIAGAILIAIFVIPYEIIGLLHSIVGWNIEGIAMVWLMAVGVPAMVLGPLLLIVGVTGGLAYLIRKPKAPVSK